MSAGVAIVLAFCCATLHSARLPGGRIFLGVILTFWLLAYGSALAAANQEGGRSGRLSRKMMDGIHKLSSGLPPGSVILMGEGPPARTAYFWQWALPFALQPPFSDVDSKYRVIGSPRLFCCRNWRDVRGPVIQHELVEGASPLYVLNWEESREELARRIVSREQLEAVYEEVLGRPRGAPHLSEQEAVKLRNALSRIGQPIRHSHRRWPSRQ